MTTDYNLAYVHGYGFCLYIDETANPVKLGGDGERTPDKQLVLDAFADQRKQIATLEKAQGDYQELKRLHDVAVQRTDEDGETIAELEADNDRLEAENVELKANGADLAGMASRNWNDLTFARDENTALRDENATLQARAEHPSGKHLLHPDPNCDWCTHE